MPMASTSASLNGTVKGATTLVAIRVAPARQFVLQRFRDEREQLVHVDRAGNEANSDRQHRLEQPIAQLQQVRDQRTFGEPARFALGLTHWGGAGIVRVVGACMACRGCVAARGRP